MLCQEILPPKTWCFSSPQLMQRNIFQGRGLCHSAALAKCSFPSCGHFKMDEPLWSVTWEINLFWEGDSLAHFMVFLFLLILYFIASKRASAMLTPLLGIQHVLGYIIHAMFPAIQQTKRKGEGNEVRKKCFVLLKSCAPTCNFSIQFL